MAGEMLRAYFIKLLFGSRYGACLSFKKKQYNSNIDRILSFAED